MLPVLSLHAAVYYALEHNPTLQIAYENQKLNEYQLVVVRQSYEPQWSLLASTSTRWTQTGDAPNSEPTPMSSGGSFIGPSMKWMLPLGTTVSTDIGDYQAGWQPSHSSSTSWGVSITQPLLKGFGREVTMNPLYQAEDEVTTSRYQLEDEISQLILQVINDYYAVLQATQSLAINQEMLTEDQQQLANRHALFSAGRIPHDSVVQSELDVSSQELSLAQAKQASAAAMETLKTDLGMPSYEQVRVNPVIRVIEIHPQLQTALDAAFKSNRQVKSAEIALKEAQRGLDIDANSRLWDLDLTLNHRQGYANTSGFTPYSPLYPGQDRSTGGDTSIGLSLTVPLDQDVERTQASLEAAVSDENAELALASARRTLKSTVETQLQTLNSAWEQIDLSRSQLTLTKESLDSAKVQFDYGKMDAFTYSQQQSGLVSAQLAVVSAEINYMTQYYQYQSITDALLPSWGVYVKALEK